MNSFSKTKEKKNRIKEKEKEAKNNNKGYQVMRVTLLADSYTRSPSSPF